MKCSFLILPIISFTTITYAHDPKWDTERWDNFAQAIRLTETNGSPNYGIGVVGDNGKALGPYQIHEVCWKDAVEYDPSLLENNKTYQDCLTDGNYSKKIMIAYIKRYLPKNSNETQACRIWNGGPKGHKKMSTLSYLKTFLKFWKK